MVKPLIIPPHRRSWEQQPRVCVTCGEAHHDGQPTPSGRECRRVKVGRYLPVQKGPAPRRDADSVFNPFPASKIRTALQEKTLEGRAARKKILEACGGNQVTYLKALKAAALKRYRDKRKLEKERFK